ncbi:MAG: hypothetical protein E7679_07050 [Ruminococcaceae bacterium]|nr:hypothetical protein [Oscillospiraceae bacterium]
MKKLLAILLLITLSLSLWSCDQNDGEDTPEQQTSHTESTTTQAQNEETKPEYADTKMTSYLKAVKLLEKGNIQEAYDIFLTIKDYGNVEEYLNCFSFKYDVKIIRDPNSATTYYYEYDEYGNQTLEIYSSRYGYSKTSDSYEYDDNHNLTKHVYVSTSGNEITRSYEYDEKGRLILFVDPMGCAVNFEYDDVGNKIKEIFDYGTILDYIYDERGNLLETIGSNSNGDITYRKINEYDIKGNLTKIVQGTEEDSQSITTFEYDEKGNILKRNVKQSDGYTYSVEYEYEYDDYGNKIKYAAYYQSGNFEKISYKYDQNGNMLEKHREDEEGKDYSEYFEYDAKGNCIKRTYTRHTSSITDVWTYEYDDYGNLIKAISPGETDSPDDYYITVYTGYKLYYDPSNFQDLPRYAGKG